jgi:protein ImuB
VRGFSGGVVRASAGPWRTSGFWWSRDGASWQREEWDVELPDGALYRLVRDRAKSVWEIEGVVD